MKRSTLIRGGVVAGVCAVAGAAAGIVGSAAAPSHKSSAPHGPRALMLRFGGPPVHGEEVVLNKARNGFITVTEDNGKVKSVSGDSLVITEGVGSVTYKDATLTIPSDATVYRNGSKASLDDLKEGDHVHVSSSSDGTAVIAFDAQHRPGPPHFGPRGGGFPGGPPGPPPGY